MQLSDYIGKTIEVAISFINNGNSHTVKLLGVEPGGISIFGFLLAISPSPLLSGGRALERLCRPASNATVTLLWLLRTGLLSEGIGAFR